MGDTGLDKQSRKRTQEYFRRRGMIKAARRMVIYCHNPEELVLCLRCEEYKPTKDFPFHCSGGRDIKPKPTRRQPVVWNSKNFAKCNECERERQRDRHIPVSEEGPEYPFESMIFIAYDGDPNLTHGIYYESPARGMHLHVETPHLPLHKRNLPESYPIW